MSNSQKHEHHEDERRLRRDPNLPRRVESDTQPPQKQEWPEEAGDRSAGSTLRDDPAMQRRIQAEKNPGKTDQMADVGSSEAKSTRGIDAGAADPGLSDPQIGGVDRQPASAPEKILDRVSDYEGSLTHDRESRDTPDMVNKGTQRGQGRT